MKMKMKQKIYAVLIACLVPFFTANAVAWTLQYDYDVQAPGDRCEDFGSSQSDVTDIVSNTGNQSCKHIIGAGETAYGKFGGIIGFPSNLVKNDEIWIRIRTFMPVGFNYDSTSGGNKLKFLRVHTRDSVEANFGYNDWYIMPSTQPTKTHAFIYEGEQIWSYVEDITQAPQLNQWETYEYYLKLDDVPASEGGQARIRAWKNGNLILDVDDRQTLKHSGAYADRIHLFTFWNGGSPKTQEMYTDDLFITTAPPSNKDASGNQFIGVVAGVKSLPNPPTKLQLNL
jgi:hypothetical protein